MEQHPELPWDWDGVSQNPNITFKYLEQHLEKPWNWDWLSENPFTAEKHQFYRKELMTKRLQRWWLSICENPYHPVGQRIINDRYDKLYLGK